MSYDTLETLVVDATKNFVDHTDIKVKQIKLTPYGNTSFSDSGNREVQFRLPRDGILIAPRSSLYVNVEPDGDSAADDKLMTDIHTIFDNFIIEVDSQEILNEKQWGWFRALEQSAKMSATDRQSAEAYQQNIPEHSVSGVATKFRLPLASKWNDVSFFSIFSALPLYKMGQVSIKFMLNGNRAEYTTATTAVQTVDLTNLELECYIVDSPKLRAMFNTDIVKAFDSHIYHKSQISSGSTSVAISVPVNVQNLKGIAMIQRPANIGSDPNWATGSNIAVNKYTHSFLLNGLSKYSVNIDGTEYPSSKQIDATNGTELTTNLGLFWDVNRLGSFYNSNVAMSNLSAGFATVPFSVTDTGVSGLNLNSKSGTVVFNATLNAFADADVAIFAKYSKFVKLAADGSISITQ